jgi:hypothetical protein
VTRRTDEELMQYFDDELDAAERETLRAELAGGGGDDPAAVTKLGALEQIRDSLRAYGELAADDVEPRLDSLWGTIEQRVRANGENENEIAPARIAEQAAPRKRPGMWAAFVEWVVGHRGHFATGALAAAVAVVLMMVIRQPNERVVERVVQVPERTAVAASASEPPVVENLEVYGGSGTVLTFPAEDGETATAVIWISRDSDDSEGPI